MARIRRRAAPGSSTEGQRCTPCNRPSRATPLTRTQVRTNRVRRVQKSWRRRPSPPESQRETQREVRAQECQSQTKNQQDKELQRLRPSKRWRTSQEGGRPLISHPELWGNSEYTTSQARRQCMLHTREKLNGSRCSNFMPRNWTCPAFHRTSVGSTPHRWRTRSKQRFKTIWNKSKCTEKLNWWSSCLIWGIGTGSKNKSRWAGGWQICSQDHSTVLLLRVSISSLRSTSIGSSGQLAFIISRCPKSSNSSSIFKASQARMKARPTIRTKEPSNNIWFSKKSTISWTSSKIWKQNCHHQSAKNGLKASLSKESSFVCFLTVIAISSETKWKHWNICRLKSWSSVKSRIRSTICLVNTHSARICTNSHRASLRIWFCHCWAPLNVVASWSLRVQLSSSKIMMMIQLSIEKMAMEIFKSRIHHSRRLMTTLLRVLEGEIRSRARSSVSKSRTPTKKTNYLRCSRNRELEARREASPASTATMSTKTTKILPTENQ